MCTASCAYGFGMCVSLKHGLVIVSDSDTKQLHLHSLEDGSLVRSIGSYGRGWAQFRFQDGGLCVGPDGDSVLVADAYNNRVQEVRIVGTEDTSRCLRFIGMGVLCRPQFVDCNADFIVVSEECHRVSVLSWHAGDLISQFGSFGDGPGQLKFPLGIRLLGDGSGVVVADYGNDRLGVFGLTGGFVQTLGSSAQGLKWPYDVMECSGGFVIANYGRDNVATVSRSGAVVDVYGGTVVPGVEFNGPSALAALPGGGFIVRDYYRRFQVLRGLGLRVEWITACVSLARVL